VAGKSGRLGIRMTSAEHEKVMISIFGALIELNYPQVEFESLSQGVDGWWLVHLWIRGSKRFVLEPIAFPVNPADPVPEISADVADTFRKILPMLVAEADAD
jgi:hypothetical protein